MRSAFLLAIVLPALLSAQSVGFVSLMPNNDVREHWAIVNTPPETWSVEDGVIACKGEPRGYLRSNKKYKNFIFRAEWRFQKEGWTQAPERWPNASCGPRIGLTHGGERIHGSLELREAERPPPLLGEILIRARAAAELSSLARPPTGTEPR